MGTNGERGNIDNEISRLKYIQEDILGDINMQENNFFKRDKAKKLKTGAKIFLSVLVLSIIAQLYSIWQLSDAFVSPIIPKSVIWDMRKQLIFTASVLTFFCIAATILYFFKKYLLVIILVCLVLLASRYIYLPEF